MNEDPPATENRHGRYVNISRGYGAHQAIVELARGGSAVLDVGCSIGLLGPLLREAGVGRVVGVEVDPAAATEARNRLDLVIQGDVQDSQVQRQIARLGLFDRVVLGDVLEHTVDPGALLTSLIELLSPDGSFVISLPNILAIRPRLRLITGRWHYEDSGPFDRTHLRFFSVAGARELVASAGLTASRELVVGPLSHRLGRFGSKLTRLRPGLLANQVVFSARPAAPPAGGRW